MKQLKLEITDGERDENSMIRIDIHSDYIINGFEGDDEPYQLELVKRDIETVGIKILTLLINAATFNARHYREEDSPTYENAGKDIVTNFNIKKALTTFAKNIIYLKETKNL